MASQQEFELEDIRVETAVESLNTIGDEKPATAVTEAPVFVTEAIQKRRIREARKAARAAKRASSAAVAGKRKKKKKKGDAEDLTEIITEHKLPLDELATKLGTSIDLENPKNSRGLSAAEAKRRLETNGPNVLTPPRGTPLVVKFLKQFTSFFPLLLESGGVMCFIAYALDQSSLDNLYLGIILWAVVIITAIFAFSQETKSAKVMEGFAKMAPSASRVCRDGLLSLVEAAALVVGDIVHIRSGDKVPADLRLIHVAGLKVDNSCLTGESEPQPRDVEPGHDDPLEAKNLAFYSTLVTEGDAVGVVIRTADNTMVGRIADLAANTALATTPLQKEIDRFIKIISIVACSLGLVFFAIGFAFKIHWLPNIIFVIGIVVANVPEGLLPTVTVALTLTAKRMARKNVRVKNLLAVETLGSTSTIASDKTGTLTQNRMSVAHVYYDGAIWTVDTLVSTGHVDPQSPSFAALHRCAVLCNRAVFDSGASSSSAKSSERRVLGDASESALLRFCDAIRPVDEDRMAAPKLLEIPFDSAKKWQLSVHEVSAKTSPGLATAAADASSLATSYALVLLKGAPERIISRCERVLYNGVEMPLDAAGRDKINADAEALAGNGERVMGFAQIALDPAAYPPGKFEFSVHDGEPNFPTTPLTFLGLVSFIDPPRPEVPDAIAKCKTAGIRVIMVTGDHPLTAAAIARQVGIIEGDTVEDIAKREGVRPSEVDPTRPDAVVVKGHEIPSLTEQDWDRILSKRQIVFARTSPEQKLQIVEQCQRRHEIVAVTGDGVNDSPALKQADLGCAMGIAGSDVAKEAASIVLLDDNFASLVCGVEEGRIIFDNLKKSICYTLSSNSAELAPFLLFILAQMPLALSAVLILCIDLGTDMIPAISLAYESPESDIMKRPPRDARRDRLVTGRLAIYSYAWLGTWQAVAGFINYFVVLADYGIMPSDAVGISVEYFRLDSPDFHGYSAREQVAILYEAQSAFFVAVVITRIGCLLVCKNRKLTLFRSTMFSNYVFNIGVCLEIALALIIVYTPGLNEVFGTRPLSWKLWFIPLPWFVFVLVSDEIRKYLIRRNPRSKFARYTYW